MKKRVILWVLTILWAGIIFSFSAQPAAESRKFSEKIKAEIVQNISEEAMDSRGVDRVERDVHYIVRKSAHFCLYLVLGVLLILLCDSYGIKNLRGCLIALGASILYGASDELHQLLVPERGCQAVDVLLDAVGALTGILLVMLCRQIGKVVIKNK